MPEGARKRAFINNIVAYNNKEVMLEVVKWRLNMMALFRHGAWVTGICGLSGCCGAK